MNSRPTQADRGENHMRCHGGISTYEAYSIYGVTRLSARIWELKHNRGLDIRKRKVKGKNRFGETVSWDRYYIHECEAKGKQRREGVVSNTEQPRIQDKAECAV